MEEIEFAAATTTATEEDQGQSSVSSNGAGAPAVAPAANNNNNNSEPLRLPRTGGSSRGAFLRDTIQSQIPSNEQLEKRKQQAGRVFKSFGNQLSKINLSKIIDNMEQDQGLADSLEKLNSRMKEEVERQEVRKEAEELTLKIITDHLDEFLVENPLGTYEEWIQDLHPENANQGKLLSDIQQIDERFYVFESDHRKLWNDAVEKQQQQQGNNADNNNSYAHRLVEARTQIWGKAPGANANASQNSKSGYSDDSVDNNNIPTNNPMIDLLSGSVEFAAPPPPKDNGVEEIDFFAPTTTHAGGGGRNTGIEMEQNIKKEEDPFQDLIKF